MFETFTRTARVFVRHSEDCKDRDKGTDYRRCNCRKSILYYDGQKKANRRISANTRSWQRAEAFAVDFLDQFDPLKAEIKKLKQEAEAKETLIDVAVSAYFEDMRARNLKSGTIKKTTNSARLQSHELAEPPESATVYLVCPWRT